ncbi:MAG TPA: M48 family metallopeptidase [bacterium]|nr:M48 family metallopeptidase [bacterium]HQL63913.1 M48 family metallopeptidase [bacterium]
MNTQFLSFSNPSFNAVRIVRRHFPICLIGVAVLSFFSCAGMEGGGGGFNLISESEERQLGTELSQEIAKQGELVEDAVVVGYVRDVGLRLIAVSAKPDYSYQFHVLKKDEVNAFAIAGGHLYVQTGLILAADNEAQLAGVMAHELGHVENRHVTQQMSRQYGISLLTSVLLGNNPSQTKQIVAGLLGNATIMKYSRDAEREADWTAVHLLYRAGYDPMALADFFRKLKEDEERSPGPLESLFLSHPMTDDRIAAVEAEIKKLAPKTPTRTDNSEFLRVQARLK